MDTSTLRQRFLDYFARHGHRIVPSSPLVPGNDPTLLFTNAGMVQFKDVFLGRDPRSYTRATSVQRCVRAGGKHNDLENVGYTARHHTFFEMLGNFSFGDYFKKDAIRFAWEFVTQDLGIPPEKLWVTVFRDDDEAADLWLKDVGVDLKRFTRLDEKSNFWSMGDTGPCGPCSEIFYDHGDHIPGGPPGSPDEDGDRYVEIWNLVFMQFDRAADGTMTPLPKPSVDTGMGLERVAAVMQGVHSNYDIDLFRKLIAAAAKATGTKDLQSNSLKVIADHIRASAFLVVDGVLPGNEGRGYVLRRIIRRALRHGHELGQQQPFFHQLVATLVAEMGAAYPELAAGQAHVEKVLLTEEERFAETLSQGMAILKTAMASGSSKQLAGDVVFKLYDTYGFPVDLTADVARAAGFTIDRDGFEQAMEAQRDRARAAQKFNVAYGADAQLDAKSRFLGYEQLEGPGTIVALLRDGQPVQSLNAGDQGAVVLDQTPFYAESGGQVGDQGVLSGHGVRFTVADTKKSGEAHVHLGTLDSGTLKVGDRLDAQVDAATRNATVLNHSATHLLHAALRQVLGSHVTQKGSLVAPDKLRFDFSHYEAVTPEQLATIEALVNDQIRRNAAAETRVMKYDDAVAAGAMALFGEKYGDEVRVLSIGDFSTELCGGTHVHRAGDIGLFKITAESGIAAGIRRIEAVTGSGALARVAETEHALDRLAALFRGGRADVEGKVRQALDRSKALEREIQQLKARLAAGAGGRDLASEAREVAGCKLLVARLDDGIDAQTLRETVDRMKDKLVSGIVVLAAADPEGGKVNVAVGVTKDLTGRLKAGDLVNAVASQIGGKGGGRPDFAQAGGSDIGALDGALKTVPEWLRSRLAPA
ncbi:MAG: alanine--tRNA ligase [Gammaproteobacteria bacterium PRO9]|nr:alanine--tRNA ligase [Gammaproteobacteria bacterium PRO9]